MSGFVKPGFEGDYLVRIKPPSRGRRISHAGLPFGAPAQQGMARVQADPGSRYWSCDLAALAAQLSSSAQGLSSAEAAARLQRYGVNAVEDVARLSAMRLYARQFESPLVLILIFGAGLALALAEWMEAGIILSIVFGSTLLGFFQEYRASAAVEQLKRRLALTCRVLRDGAETTVPASAIVPGDVVLLSAGNLVPADGVVIAANDFLVSEASLTGEAYPVEKRPGVVAADAALAARSNCAFLGTSVRSGTARLLVAETGRRTVFGSIAARLKTRAPETEFQRGVRQFGYLLIRVMIVIVLFVLTVNQLLGRPVVDSLLFAVALAVGLSPELLPAIVSVTLAAGARAMARNGVIVRRLESIENLGSMDVLCTDKTATLTAGVIALSEAVDPQGVASGRIRTFAFLNAAFESGIDNPLDAALVAAGRAHGLTTEGYRKIDEIPYDFRRKRLTIVVEEARDPAHHLIVTKGAFSSVLDICTTVETDDAERPLTPAMRAEYDAYYRAKGMEGFRVLALAIRRPPARERYEHADETGMCFAGLLLFFDPPKEDARRIIDDLTARGIGIKVISGDNRYVTAHVAQAVGLNPQSLLTGEQLAAMSDQMLRRAAPRTALFAEVDPQQKERIVRALQHGGHVVGYLGDGINDAPSLHAADVGISVDQAVDVARESADIVLLRPDLQALRRGVDDGRRTFLNTLKYIRITTSANFGNMISMALATPLLPFLPLAAKQILLNNFLSDLPAAAISTDNVDPEASAKPQHWQIADLQRFMIVFGLISSAFDLITFGALILLFHAGETLFQTMWFVLSLLTELAVAMVLRTQRAAWRSRPSGFLLWMTLAAITVALALPDVGPLAAMFGFVPLSGAQLAATLAIVAGYIAATEAAKHRFYRAHTRRARGHAAHIHGAQHSRNAGGQKPG